MEPNPYRAFCQLSFDFDLNMSLSIAANEYDGICAALKNGQSFYEAMDEYGSLCMISLKGLTAVYQLTESARRQCAEDRHAKEREDSLT